MYVYKEPYIQGLVRMSICMSVYRFSKNAFNLIDS